LKIISREFAKLEDNLKMGVRKMGVLGCGLD
jgi:hypothetical protein